MRKFVCLGSLKDYVVGVDEEKQYWFQAFPRIAADNDEEEIKKIITLHQNDENMSTDPRFKVIGWTTGLFNWTENFSELWALCKKEKEILSENLSKLHMPGEVYPEVRLVIYDSNRMVITCTQYALATEI